MCFLLRQQHHLANFYLRNTYLVNTAQTFHGENSAHRTGCMVWGLGEGGMRFVGGRRCENRGGAAPPRRWGWRGTPGGKASPKESRRRGEELTAGRTRNAEAVAKAALSEPWSCLRTIVPAEEHVAAFGDLGWRRGCCWHRAHGGQRRCRTPDDARAAPPTPPSPALFPQHLGTSQSLDSHPGNPCASCFQLHSQRAPGKGGIGSPPCIDYSLWKSLGMLPSLFHILVTHRIWGSFCIIQWQPEGP